MYFSLLGEWKSNSEICSLHCRGNEIEAVITATTQSQKFSKHSSLCILFYRVILKVRYYDVVISIFRNVWSLIHSSNWTCGDAL